MIVVDTNVISEFMKPETDPVVFQWMLDRDDVLGIPTVAIAEIEFGISRLPDGRRKVDFNRRFESLMATVIILPLDEASAREAGRFRAERQTAGHPIQAADAMIAGTALIHGGPLATRNIRDFRGLPIRLIDPWAS